MAASSARPWALLLLACAWPMVASAPARGRTLGDIFYVRQGSTEQLAAAYFPHWVHRVKYKCYVCHDELFPMRRGANPTMAMMAKGQSCGACHNGKVAFGADACHRCHAQR